jgi:ketol-acid reductoisomerase
MVLAAVHQVVQVVERQVVQVQHQVERQIKDSQVVVVILMDTLQVQVVEPVQLLLEALRELVFQFQLLVQL